MSTEGSGKDGRKSVRYVLSERVHFRAVMETGTTIDVSESGVSFSAFRALPLGSDVDVCFFNGAVAIKGVVRHQVPLSNGAFRIGVEFDDKQREVIEFFLKNEESGVTLDTTKPMKTG
ncbi:MAG: PilZ domain-containing protein [Candidatus Lambdaproteobacteria bacterium]|nr:PilZ domain-containing protein [Candidatus Lambdaproteobacteria bacterium]